MRMRHLPATMLVSGLAAIASAPAVASEDFGRHVADCAQISLGARPDAPDVTCSHHGEAMTFPNYGAMVHHMQSMHD